MGQSLAIRALRALIRKENPDCIFLMETRLDTSTTNSLWKRLDFYEVAVVPAIGQSGRLCLMWRYGVHLDLISSSKHGLIVYFHPELQNPGWLAYLTYGRPHVTDPKAFWKSLSVNVKSRIDVWACIGGLNLILSADEKLGGAPVRPNQC